MSITNARIPHHMQKSKIFWKVVATSTGTRVNPPFIQTAAEELAEYGADYGSLKTMHGQSLKKHAQLAGNLEKEFQSEVKKQKAALIQAVKNKTEIPGGRVSQEERQRVADLAQLKGRVRSTSGEVDYNMVAAYQPNETRLPSAERLARAHINDHLRDTIASKEKAAEALRQDLRRKLQLGGVGQIGSSKKLVRSIPVKVSPFPSPHANFLPSRFIGDPFANAPYHVSEIMREYNLGLSAGANNDLKKLAKQAAQADTYKAIASTGLAGEMYFVDAAGNLVSINERQRRTYKL